LLTRIAIAAVAASILVAPTAYAGKKHASGMKHVHASANGKTCKKEFMFMKGHKCVDARKSKA
jgi:hypothetical protein